MDAGIQLVTLPDDRQLEVIDCGPVAAIPLVFHYGTPGAALRFEPWVDTAVSRGLRMILMSRPGYAASTPDPGRAVADVAADTAAVLDHLGATEFVCLGWSGGGPHALACSAQLRDRCLAAATVASVAPYGATGLDFLAGMGPENVEEFGLAINGGDALRPFLEENAAAYREITAEEVTAALGGLLSSIDQESLTGDFAEFLAEQFRRAFSAGVEGWYDDDLAFVKPWGFALDDVGAVSVWQGEEDRMVPFSHGQWLAEHVPHARPHLLPGHGHLSLGIGSFGEVLDDLVEVAGL